MKGLICLLFVFFTFKGRAQESRDTMLIVRMKNVDVIADRNWGNDTIQYQYNQMKYYITTILPYLNAATTLFNELNEKMNNHDISKKERKDFINSKENELHTKFENEVRRLNETQGILLIKLIARQTGTNIYSTLSEFKNPFTAIKWQAWAKLHGFNLNRKYLPEEEPMLEHIMASLNYPLPSLYGETSPLVLKNEQIHYQTKKRN